MWTHVVFLLFVALAVYAQNLTGFALALILLGLIGATDLLPLPDAVNAVTVMGLVNAATFLYRRRALRLQRLLWPAVAGSLFGILVGTTLLTWLAGSAQQGLRLLLGCSIVICAVLLWRAAKPLQTVSSPASFALAGGISGLMAGLFAVPGPPLVYLLYRQPISHARIQESLFLFFGIGAVLRLALVVSAEQFSLHSAQLAVEAIPVILVVTTFAARRPSPLSPKLLRASVCLLLIAVGMGMISASVSAMWRP